MLRYKPVMLGFLFNTMAHIKLGVLCFTEISSNKFENKLYGYHKRLC